MIARAGAAEIMRLQIGGSPATGTHHGRYWEVWRRPDGYHVQVAYEDLGFACRERFQTPAGAIYAIDQIADDRA